MPTTTRAAEAADGPGVFDGMRRIGSITALLAAAIAVSAACAQDGESAPPPAVTEALRTLIPEQEPGSVRPAAVAGLWEVAYGARVYYLSADGRYLLGGPLVDLESRANLTEAAARRERVRLLESVPEDDRVIFAPDRPRHRVTVFTDIDCGYCRKLHGKMAEYNALGIAIHYVAFPRAGLNSESAAKARAVWCAKDRQDALTRAKRGEDPEPARCQDPVAEQFQLGAEMDITGTPALILEDGRLLSGYLEPEALGRVLAGEQPVQP